MYQYTIYPSIYFFPSLSYTAARSDNVIEEKRMAHKQVSVPRIMASNPMYEATTPIYECFPENIKSLSDSRLPHLLPSSMDIPPQVMIT